LLYLPGTNEEDENNNQH